MRMSCFYLFFFFSSRRRHTRFDCDWSSDVCSSDLPRAAIWSSPLPCACHSRSACAHRSRLSFLPPLLPSTHKKRGPQSAGPKGAELLPKPLVTTPDPSNQERSEEHTSELQSQSNLVCRLLLEKKKKNSAQ